MKLSVAAFALLTVAGLVTAAEPPTKLQIGTKKRVPASECLIKTVKGDRVSMQYTGRLWEGEQFDTSVGRGPFEFMLGQGQVIRGWDQGLTDMCIGEKRKLTIPAPLGYGKMGAGGTIPPDATLVFDGMSLCTLCVAFYCWDEARR